MTAKAGEKAQKAGGLHCADCSEKVHVKQGDKIPSHPNGHQEFGTRRNEPGNKTRADRPVTGGHTGHRVSGGIRPLP